MSREVSKAEEVAWAVLRATWGIAQTVVVLTVVGLVVEHIKRKMDAGLVHWPGKPEAKIWLGVPPWWPMPTREQAAPPTPGARPGPDLAGLLGAGLPAVTHLSGPVRQ